jgi:hypothetical protein
MLDNTVQEVQLCPIASSHKTSIQLFCWRNLAYAMEKLELTYWCEKSADIFMRLKLRGLSAGLPIAWLNVSSF